ncbi:hypothetical protein KC347_g5986 [Hortaea werneckii]|nr:hypothetical protein KC347_g5986 [Hortaea werneckii]
MATKTLRSNTTGTLSQPVTAIYKNMTLTSPTVYIEFKTAYATDACGYTVGNPHPGAIVGVDPKSLYSVYAKLDYFVDTLNYGEGTTTFYQSNAFNFHDLSGLAPGPAYQAQPSCWDNGCHTIFNDYHPVLVLPSQVRDLDPAFVSCGLDWRGAWDPPIALQPAEVLAPVITAVEPKYTQPASPKSTVPRPPAETVAAKASISNNVRQSASSSDPPEPSIRSSTSSKPSPSSKDPKAQANSGSDANSSPVIATLYTSQVLPEESDGLHDTAPSQRPTGDATLEYSGIPYNNNDDAATDDPSDHTAIANSGSVFIDPGVENSSPDDGNAMLASPTNAFEVVSEALRRLKSLSMASGHPATVPIESFASEGMNTKSLDVETAPLLSTGHSAAQAQSISDYGGETHTTSTAHFADGTLVQPLETPSALGSQSIALFTMDGSVLPASGYNSAGFQVGTHTLTPGRNPVIIGDHVLSASTGGSYEHTQFSLVSSTQTRDTVVSTSLEASVVAISEASKRGWIIDGHTLTEGGPAVVLGSHTISVGTEGLSQDGNTLSGPAPSSKATISSEESSPESRLPIVTTAYNANQHSSGNGQGESARSHSHATSKTSSAAKRHAGRLLNLTFCFMTFSLIALPYV